MKSEVRCFWGTQSLQIALLAQFRFVKAPPVAFACPHVKLWARIVDTFSSISSAVALNTALLQSFMTVIFWSKCKGFFCLHLSQLCSNSFLLMYCSNWKSKGSKCYATRASWNTKVDESDLGICQKAFWDVS